MIQSATNDPTRTPSPAGGRPALTTSARERFRRASRCQSVDRPPVWLMRQAGRALPEYRALKQDHDFLELVRTPDLAVEVTLQPIRRFGFDAAILFSDILVVPEAMGQGYRFRETGGIAMDFAVQSKADIDRLSVDAVCERLSYVQTALELLRRELGDETALIGFSGSPWTLATFMMEGGSAENPIRTIELMRSDPKTFGLLMAKLTEAITAYLRMQAGCGVDALQIFDSHGGLLTPAEFQEGSGRWIREIITELKRHEPAGPGQPDGSSDSGPALIVFSLGTHESWPDLVETGADVLGVDWHSSLENVRARVPDRVALQGNLRPSLLAEAEPEEIAVQTARILEGMRGRPGHIFNLGHGTPPTARLEGIAALVQTVKGFSS